MIARALVHAEKYREANDLFIDAREADASHTDAYIGQGELLLEKYNYAEAASLFDDALKINPGSVDALVGLARSKQISSASEPLGHRPARARGQPELGPGARAALVARAGGR